VPPSGLLNSRVGIVAAGKNRNDLNYFGLVVTQFKI
jgi:hypothetical protein